MIPFPFSYFLKVMFVAISSLVTLSGILLYKYQSLLIYPSYLGDSRKHTDKPSALGLPFQELYLPTRDGVRLHTFILLHDPTAPTYTNKTVIVLCPNAGNIGHALPIVELLYSEYGCNVVIYSYRGYGESTGTASEKGLKIDAETVLEYVSSDEQLSKSSVILYGRSLGGACGIYIASKNYDVVKGVIIENTFLSIKKCVPHVFPFLTPFLFLVHQVWPSEDDIKKAAPNVAWLFLNGEKDEVVPPAHMKKLYELCKSNYKRKRSFPARHNDTIEQNGYWDLIHDFISSIPVEKS